jgi:DNA-directed RNA polymerase subunit K/omega
MRVTKKVDSSTHEEKKNERKKSNSSESRFNFLPAFLFKPSIEELQKKLNSINEKIKIYSKRVEELNANPEQKGNVDKALKENKEKLISLTEKGKKIGSKLEKAQQNLAVDNSFREERQRTFNSSPATPIEEINSEEEEEPTDENEITKTLIPLQKKIGREDSNQMPDFDTIEITEQHDKT